MGAAKRTEQQVYRAFERIPNVSIDNYNSFLRANSLREKKQICVKVKRPLIASFSPENKNISEMFHEKVDVFAKKFFRWSQIGQIY